MHKISNNDKRLNDRLNIKKVNPLKSQSISKLRFFRTRVKKNRFHLTTGINHENLCHIWSPGVFWKVEKATGRPFPCSCHQNIINVNLYVPYETNSLLIAHCPFLAFNEIAFINNFPVGLARAIFDVLVCVIFHVK